MSSAQVAALGAIAGLTIFLGLPVGRMRARTRSLRTFLNGLSAGILVFLLVDILENAGGVLEDSLARAQSSGAWAHFVGITAIFVGGFAVGLLSLLSMGKAMRRPRSSLGPGAMAY